MTVLLTLLSHGATGASRQAAFPADDPLLDRALPGGANAVWRTRRCLCSPMTACLQTARGLGLDPRIDPDLRDLDHGQWSGRALADVARADPDAVRRWTLDPAFRDHGGESRDQLVLRMAGWLDRVAAAGDHVVAVTHAAVIRSLVCHVLAAPAGAFWSIDVAPATVTDLRHDGRRWAVRALGCPLVAAG